MDEQQLDPESDIVTVIIDAVTDKRHFHLVKPNANPEPLKHFEKVNRPPLLPALSW